MKKVFQKPNHCVPACLESIFYCLGIEKNQEEIAIENPDVFQNGVLIDGSKLNTVLSKYGIKGIFQDEFDLNKLDKVAAKSSYILLFWQDISKHCVRFLRINQKGNIEVMDPQKGDFDEYDVNKISQIKPHIVYIELF